MHLLLLTARPETRTNHRLAETAVDLGLDLALIDATTVPAIAGAGGASRLVADDVLEHPPDGVLARVGNWRPASVLAVLEACVDSGAATPNSPSAIRIGRDHWQTIRLLAAADLPVPSTLAGADPETLAEAAVRDLGLPVVVKQRQSRMGVGVILCTARDHLEAVLDSLWRVGDEVVVQRWLPGGRNSHRLLVVGAEVVAAARFSAGAGEWRSNAARGGSAEKITPDSDEKRLAVSAARILGLGHCGIDMVAGEHGPVILEVNPTPGFLCLEEATGVDVARALVEHLVACVNGPPE
ncbi:MAG: RimK family alpha-L-glutamate ligase [Thermoanaerobaculales bacterium]